MKKYEADFKLRAIHYNKGGTRHFFAPDYFNTYVRPFSSFLYNEGHLDLYAS